MTARQQLIEAFLARHGWSDAHQRALHGDASTRRYVRLQRGAERAVLMDAALPEHRTGAFLQVAGLLQTLELSPPQILAADDAHGLVLLEDLGDLRIGASLDAGADPEPLMQLAVDVLIALHRAFDPADPAAVGLPRYDAGLFADQLTLFAEVVPAHLGMPCDRDAIAAFRAAWTAPLGPACAGRPSLLLRDYFADNLMHLPERSGVRACGLLDFQDAGIGPVGYDLVSLLEDARRDIAPELAAACLARYRDAFPALDAAAFAAACDVLAAVRHCRIIAVFVRLADAGRPHYLQHLPRLWRLFDRHLQAPALQPVAAWCDRHLPARRRT